ncbi:hypothetical protein D3C74_135840 [compost metagenome]
MTTHGTASPKKQTPFDYTLSVIGGKWSMKLMYQLAINGVTRYGGLKRSIPEQAFDMKFDIQLDIQPDMKYDDRNQV